MWGKVAQNPLTKMTRRLTGDIAKSVNKFFKYVSLGTLRFDPAPSLSGYEHDRNLVEIQVIGRQGAVLQDLGRPASKLTLRGRFFPKANVAIRPDTDSGTTKLVVRKLETPESLIAELRFMDTMQRVAMYFPDLKTPEFWGLVKIKRYKLISYGGYANQFGYEIDMLEETPFGSF